MTEILLTKEQAYQAMFNFIEHLYEITNDSSLGGFLGSMQLDRDGMPFDPAYWEDWEKAVEKTLVSK
jgi:hypothetical protein